jgi:hypothetical protein
MDRHVNEQDEFLLSRLLDGDLPAEEASALRKRMDDEPALRAAFDGLGRLDAMLQARRADAPRIDFSRFHQQVMAAVETRGSEPAIIKLSKWLRYAAPLAAAAAIALLVLAYWRDHHPARVDPPVVPAIVENTRPEPRHQPDVMQPEGPAARPAMVVRYGRPRSLGQRSNIQVSYSRSDKLFDEYRAMDHRNRVRGEWMAHAPSAQPRSAGIPLFEEAPPI